VDADVDVAEFDAAIVSQRPEELERAVALYRAPLLEDCAEEWAPQERDAREQDCLRALGTLAEIALAAGEYGKAAEYFRRAVGIAPQWEAAQRGLMQALSLDGDGTAALNVYRAFVRLLRDEDPRATPDDTTTALYAELRAEVRRRISPQAVAAGEDAIVPAVAGYLPHPMTNLVGREQECADVAAHLRRSRLVTITGPGGIGKTRMAIEISSEVTDEFSGGVWFVALEAFSDGVMLSRQIAVLFGLKEESTRNYLNVVTDYLRAKRLLLVLDNCEHIVEECARVTSHLLMECPGVRVLATSREALGIAGEAVWAAPPLSTPDLDHLPAGQATLMRVLPGYESVQLFIERAQAAQRTFALTGGNALGVARVCAQLEGIPLAIELAAARAKLMTIDQIVARLHDHLGFLTGGNRTAQSRQMTLRSTLDWSYDLLSEPERILLRRLSVFAGGWDLQAAERVCSGEMADGEAGVDVSQIGDLLASLVDKSLAIFEEHAREGRYRSLEMVRQYAREQLEASGELDVIRNRHRDFFLCLAEEAESPMRSLKPGVWPLRLEAERDNMRAALQWCETNRNGARAGLRLAGSLFPFWSSTSDYTEGITYLKQFLAHIDTQEMTGNRGKALYGAGILANRQGDYASARVLFEQSLAVFRLLGDDQGRVSALGNLCDVARKQGDQDSTQMFYDEACALYEETLKLQLSSGDKRGSAISLNLLGLLANNHGDFAVSQARFEESLVIFQELDDKTHIAGALINLSSVVYYRGDIDSACRLLERSLTAYRDLGDGPGAARVLFNLGYLARMRGDYSTSRALLAESLDVFRILGDKTSISITLDELAHADMDCGDYESVQLLQLENLTICKELGDRPGVAGGLEGMAAALLGQELALKAARLWGAAEALRESIGAPLSADEFGKNERQVEQARLLCNSDAFAAAWEDGRSLSWEQAVTYAQQLQ